MVIAFNEGVLVGKAVLHSVLLSSVKGDTLCDFECGPADVSRAQVIPALFFCFQETFHCFVSKVVWQRLQQRCSACCLKAHTDSDLAAASLPFVRCYAKVDASLRPPFIFSL